MTWQAPSAVTRPRRDDQAPDSEEDAAGNAVSELPRQTSHSRPAWSAAERLAIDTLLRCWVREHHVQVPDADDLRLRLAAVGVTIVVPVRYRSAAGWHMFGTPRLISGISEEQAEAQVPAESVDARSGRDDRRTASLLLGRLRQVRRRPRQDAASADPPRRHPDVPARTRGRPLDVATLTALLGRESAATLESSATRHGESELVVRVLDSTRRVAAHLSARREEPDDRPGTTPFLSAEQALLAGHPLHPAPKSRDGITSAEACSYSPELRGSFVLHWFAADRSVAHGDSALDIDAFDLVDKLCGGMLGVPQSAPAETVLVPTHPWQARDLLHRPAIRGLIERGALIDVGPAGPVWYPTSSLRTVYRPGAPVMLKLSLALRVTNARRENRRGELRRGVALHRMLAAGLAADIAARSPRLRVITDPAWLAVDVPGHTECSGLDVLIRQNPFGQSDHVACVAALVDLGQPAADGAREAGHGGRLAALVRRAAARRSVGVPRAAFEWFERYLRELVLPVLAVDADYGVTLSAHQQNTLVSLDSDGMPLGGWYRDTRHVLVRSSRLAVLERYGPGVATLAEAAVPDAVAVRQLGYHLGVNNLLGVVGALGSSGLLDEELALRHARSVLSGFAVRRAALGGAHDVTEMLLDAPKLPCKANLATRVADLDEGDDPGADQAIYTEIDNPLAASA